MTFEMNQLLDLNNLKANKDFNKIFDTLYRKYLYIFNIYDYEEEILTTYKKYLTSKYKNSKNSKLPVTDVKKQIEAIVISIISKNLDENNKIFNISKKYIENKMEQTDNYEEILKQFRKLTRFYGALKYKPTLDLCIDLINALPSINEKLKIVYANKEGELLFNKTTDALGNTLIALFMDAYLIINDIEIEEDSKSENNYSKDIDQMYFADIKKELLTREEEIELFKKYNAGDIKAKNKIIEHNLKLVIKYAGKYAYKGLEFMDLIGEGNIGLIKAVERFDVTKGYRFSTYATWWIRQAMGRALADHGRIIRVPVHVHEKLNKVKTMKDNLTNVLGREPSYLEIAQQINLDEATVKELLNADNNIVSLQAFINEDESSSLEEFIKDDSIESPEEVALNKIKREELLKILDTLRDREKRVLILRYGINDGKPKTLEEIGKELGVTRERVRQIEAKALRKLRLPSKASKLQDFYND